MTHPRHMDNAALSARHNELCSELAKVQAEIDRRSDAQREEQQRDRTEWARSAPPTVPHHCV